MIINRKFLDELTEKAAESPRLRMNYDMRTTSEDSSQRMFNALEPGTELPVHRHCGSSETVVVVRGKIEQQFFDNEGNIIESIIAAPCSDIVAVNVPVGAWHRTIALEHGTVIFESKDGRYAPLTEEDILTL